MNVDVIPLMKTNTKFSRFSLATLLLLFTVVALGISHFLTSRDLVENESELTEYRLQYGKLVVDDPERVHLLVYVDHTNPWKWHAHFPKGKEYQLVAGIAKFAPDEIPDIGSLKNGAITSVIGDGELSTLSVFIDDSDTNTVELKISHSAGAISRKFPKADVPWLNFKQSTIRPIGSKEQFVAKKNGPIPIFWMRKAKIQGGMVSVEPGQTEGIILYAIPAK